MVLVKMYYNHTNIFNQSNFTINFSINITFEKNHKKRGAQFYETRLDLKADDLKFKPNMSIIHTMYVYISILYRC